MPGRLSNSPLKCKSLKSYNVSFICDHSITLPYVAGMTAVVNLPACEGGEVFNGGLVEKQGLDDEKSEMVTVLHIPHSESCINSCSSKRDGHSASHP